MNDRFLTQLLYLLAFKTISSLQQ